MDKESFIQEDEEEDNEDEDVYRCRKHFSRLIKKICECIGSDIVYDYYLKELQQWVETAKTEPSKVKHWI